MCSTQVITRVGSFSYRSLRSKTMLSDVTDVGTLDQFEKLNEDVPIGVSMPPSGTSVVAFAENGDRPARAPWSSKLRARLALMLIPLSLFREPRVKSATIRNLDEHPSWHTSGENFPTTPLDDRYHDANFFGITSSFDSPVLPCLAIATCCRINGKKSDSSPFSLALVSAPPNRYVPRRYSY